MLRAASTKAEKMIKVDHAGENGAVNIYRAQVLVTRLRCPELQFQLRENQHHEEQHRSIFAAYLATHGMRRCSSYHLCGIGGFALGFVTAIMGRKAIHAATYAVEHVVLAHLAEQKTYLRIIDAEALQCVAQIHADEQAHHDNAEIGIGQRNVMTQILISIVQICTKAVIRFGMRG